MAKPDGAILLVDDDQAVLYTAKLILKQEFARVDTESVPSQVSPRLAQTSYDVILLDMNFAPGKTSGEEGLYWIKEIRAADPSVRIIVTTAYGDIPLAVKAMQEGAVDFLQKPWESEKLLTTIRAIYQLSRAQREVTQLKGTATHASARPGKSVRRDHQPGARHAAGFRYY